VITSLRRVVIYNFWILFATPQFVPALFTVPVSQIPPAGGIKSSPINHPSSAVLDADGLFADTADADIRPVANSPDDPIVAAVVLRAPNRAYVSAPLLRASKCRHPAATFPLARRQRVAGAEDVQPAVRSRASAPRAGRSGAGHQGRQELPLFLGLGRNSPWV
jgi:hypothetical protein